ncbi:MAG TPA: hypothetical protein VFW49_00555 [Fluviicoccus sp.]|nr:hypothetical protein [Fluviicoccus sp.]
MNNAPKSLKTWLAAHLGDLCTPLNSDQAYFRPFVCKGDIETADIFLVGINPATPIHPSDMTLDNYMHLLQDYDRFLALYSSLRQAQGKTTKSRTRTGMDAFIQWLSSACGHAILETNVIPYPTKDVKALRKVPEATQAHAKAIFMKLLTTLKPRLLVVHGKESACVLEELLINAGLLAAGETRSAAPIETLESMTPWLKFTYPDGKLCQVVVCRHFMYYGKSGESFRLFRERLEKLL